MSGNFIGDFVKGKDYTKYPIAISNGIIIHRKIDSFTDKHVAVINLVDKLKPYTGRYSGVITDILLDHALASNFSSFCPISLDEFSNFSHNALVKNKHYFSDEINLIIERVHVSRRLQSYATVEGITEAFRIMTNHTSLPDFTAIIETFIRENIYYICNTFEELYPELNEYVKKHRDTPFTLQ